MSKRKLLLADDSVTIQKVVNLTFADEGIEVITVGDGDAAMQKFVEITPDLVMVDVNMPGLDGYRICEMIKQAEETKHIPVILLVGSFEPFDEAEARRVGADDFLTKPFQSIRQLVNKVSDLLKDDKIANFAEEVAAVNSFDETLEPHPADDEINADEKFDDAEMDDEMIQTNQIGSLPADEGQKFVSEPIYQSSAEDSESDLPESLTDFQSASESEDDEDWAETQPLLKEDNDEFKGDSPNSVFSEEIVYDSEEEEDLNEEFDQMLARNQDADSMPDYSADFALDDFDLLELPQPKKDSSSKTEFYSESKDSIVTPGQNQSSTAAEQIKTADNSTQISHLTPEEIDAIAEKIVEKISEQVITKVVNEVITQLAKKK